MKRISLRGRVWPRSVKVKSAEAEFDDLSKVADERIKNTTDGCRVRLGIVGRLKVTLRSAVTLNDYTLTTCQ